MRHHSFFSTIGVFLVLFLVGTSGYLWGDHCNLEIVSERCIDFTADRSSFTLTFSSFTAGSVTNSVDVTYSVMSNDVVRSNGVVTARLSDVFPGIDLLAQFGSYTKKAGNASLTAANSGFVTVPATDTGLADKVVDSGNGRLMDGSFVVRYQAKALQDQAAGGQLRTLTVTFAAV